MKEDIVSFETALLAKQKGFPQSYEDTEIHKAYSEDGELGNVFKSNKPHTIITPTQALLHKWIIENRDKFIIIYPIGDEGDYPKFVYEIVDLTNHKSQLNNQLEYLKIPYQQKIEQSFESPAEAWDAGLQEALNQTT